MVTFHSKSRSDRFGRVKDSYWYDYGAAKDVDRIKYGYDRASNRIWRENTVAAAANRTAEENQYDGRNFRVVRKDYSAGVLTETRHFYYTSAWQVLEERVDSSTSPNRQFVWGLRYIDDCVLRDRDTSGSGTLDERLYALQDGNWNVTSVTDEDGDVQERYAYTAYGEPLFLTPGFVEQSGSSFGWEVLFTGQRWEPERYHLFRQRVYLWNVGCFATRDPAGYGSGDVNIYAYVSNDPLILTDPSGRFLFCATLAAIGTYLAWKAAESVVETTIEYGIAKATGDKSFSYTRSLGRNFVIESTAGVIPGASEARIATKVAIYTGKLALRTTLDAAYETYVPGGENRSFKENFVRAGVGNVGGDLAGAAMRRTGSFVLKKVPCGKSGMSCYEKISEVVNRRPKVLYHYGFSEANASRPGTGRLWASPYSSAPGGWAFKHGPMKTPLRVIRTGRWTPFDPSQTKVISGAALDEFQLVRFHGPFRTLKALGGQHVTIRPGAYDFRAGRLLPASPEQLLTFQRHEFGANVLDPAAAVVSGAGLYYYVVVPLTED